MMMTGTDGDALSARGDGFLSRAQYIEEIDLGEPEGPRTILSGLVPYMSAEEIAGKKVIVFANLKVRAERRRRDRRGKPRARERERRRTDRLTTYDALHLDQARKLAGIPSHGMILAASDASHEKVELLVAPEDAVVGERVRFGDSDEPQAEPQTPNQIQKKKTWEELQPLLRTNDACVPTYEGAPMMTSAGAVACATLIDASVG